MVRKLSLGSRRRASKASKEGSLRENMAKADIRAAARGMSISPEWTREVLLEFPGSADSPWDRYVHDPDRLGIGTVRYPRVVAKDAECAHASRHADPGTGRSGSTRRRPWQTSRE